MKKKLKLFLDFDETIVKTTKQFVELANKKFNTDKNWKNLKCWCFQDLYPNIRNQDIDEIFDSKELYNNIESHENCISTLNKIKDYVDINIATIGSDTNLFNKKEWLKNNFTDIDYNFLDVKVNFDRNINKHNKSTIDMSGGIFIDDRIDNLRSSNATIKILYKSYNDYNWQKCEANEDIFIVNTWDEIYEILYFCINNDVMFERCV